MNWSGVPGVSGEFRGGSSGDARLISPPPRSSIESPPCKLEPFRAVQRRIHASRLSSPLISPESIRATSSKSSFSLLCLALSSKPRRRARPGHPSVSMLTDPMLGHDQDRQPFGVSVVASRRRRGCDDSPPTLVGHLVESHLRLINKNIKSCIKKATNCFSGVADNRFTPDVE